ncbi:MAG: hypothetical protein M1834_007121 [Cirrosporium novae-zelandiae]|nr:MAG: hypothetical protein M1834_007121 [Cirrosporium novae-zelandiae]
MAFNNGDQGPLLLSSDTNGLYSNPVDILIDATFQEQSPTAEPAEFLDLDLDMDRPEDNSTALTINGTPCANLISKNPSPIQPQGETIIPNAPRLRFKDMTCRYWKLGIGGCPFRQDVCQFAHHETGLLSDRLLQMGTCWFWQNSTCQYTSSTCPYAHYETGINHPKPKHRRKEPLLQGLDADIANAAANAGFDIREWQSLMDLISAVRRAAENSASDICSRSRWRRHRGRGRADAGDHYRPRPNEFDRGRSQSPDGTRISTLEGQGCWERPIRRRSPIPTGPRLGNHIIYNALSYRPSPHSTPPSNRQLRSCPAINSYGHRGLSDSTVSLFEDVTIFLNKMSTAVYEHVGDLARQWGSDNRLHQAPIDSMLLRLRDNFEIMEDGCKGGMEAIGDVLFCFKGAK